MQDDPSLSAAQNPTTQDYHDYPVVDDSVQPFMIDKSGVPGRLVRLGPQMQEILARHKYPDPVAHLLAQLMALAANLASVLKYDGIFTLQTKSDGPVPMLVVDVTTQGGIRAYAQIKGDIPDSKEAYDAPVPTLLGTGYMAFTVDQGEFSERYQGVVELQGRTLGDCVHHYFQLSEQFSTTLAVAAATGPDGLWRAGCLSIQRLPDHGGIGAMAREESEDGWRKAVALMSTVTNLELIDPQLSAPALLFRLFHEDGVRIFDRKDFFFQCRCSRDRVRDMLFSLGEQAVHEMQEHDPSVDVTCEFCNTTHSFSTEDIRLLFAEGQKE